jgi:hypothetical protein
MHSEPYSWSLTVRQGTMCRIGQASATVATPHCRMDVVFNMQYLLVRCMNRALDLVLS